MFRLVYDDIQNKTFIYKVCLVMFACAVMRGGGYIMYATIIINFKESFVRVALRDDDGMLQYNEAHEFEQD